MLPRQRGAGRVGSTGLAYRTGRLPAPAIHLLLLCFSRLVGGGLAVGMPVLLARAAPQASYYPPAHPVQFLARGLHEKLVDGLVARYTVHFVTGMHPSLHTHHGRDEHGPLPHYWQGSRQSPLGYITSRTFASAMSAIWLARMGNHHPAKREDAKRKQMNMMPYHVAVINATQPVGSSRGHVSRGLPQCNPPLNMSRYCQAHICAANGRRNLQPMPSRPPTASLLQPVIQYIHVCVWQC